VYCGWKTNEIVSRSITSRKIFHSNTRYSRKLNRQGDPRAPVSESDSKPTPNYHTSPTITDTTCSNGLDKVLMNNSIQSGATGEVCSPPTHNRSQTSYVDNSAPREGYGQFVPGEETLAQSNGHSVSNHFLASHSIYKQRPWLDDHSHMNSTLEQRRWAEEEPQIDPALTQHGLSLYPVIYSPFLANMSHRIRWDDFKI
jgi:hypothetical protein